MKLNKERLYVRGLRLREEIPPENYLSQLAVTRHLQAMDGLEFRCPVTILVGENGTGKSTLIEALAIAMGFNAEGGTRHFRFETARAHADLHQYLTVTKGASRIRDGFFLRAESFYNAATYIDQISREDCSMLDGYGGRSLHAQSHGEAFLSLMKNRFGGQGLYILDEPEAALSPMRLMSLLCLMEQLTEAESQLIIATHSPILMAYPGADVLELRQDGIFHTDYRETEHYRITRQFLEDPRRMLHYLLEEE